MPEGPEIRLAADRLRDAVNGRKIERLFFAFDQLKSYESTLAGCGVSDVRSQGKAILTCFDNGLVLYTHNQLYGRWYFMPTGEFPSTSRQLRVALHTHSTSALLYSASEIELLDERDLTVHPYLSRLGPELLDDSVTVEEVIDRFMERRYRRRRLMNLLVDQHVISGMGNYLCCEVLFVSRLFPQTRVMDCSSEQIITLAKQSVHLTRQSYRTGGITNDLQRAEEKRLAGNEYEEYRFNVYRRAGEECYVCASPLVKQSRQGRPIYYCPVCQQQS